MNACLHCYDMDLSDGEGGDDDAPLGSDQDQVLSFKPVVLQVKPTVVFTGSINGDGHVEWDWERVPPALAMGYHKDWRMLKRCEDEYKTEFMTAQTPWSEFHYRGKQFKRGTTMESRALILMIALMPTRRQAKVNTKETSLWILKALVEITMGSSFHSCACTIMVGPDCFTRELRFENGVTDDLFPLLSHHPDCIGIWKDLGRRGYCSCRLTSSIEHATIFDLVLFLIFTKGQKLDSIWVDCGQHMWPQVIWMLGNALEECGQRLADKNELVPAPLLKTKKGYSKRVPLVNKLALLKRVKGLKSHRSLVMSSHSEVVPSKSDLVQSEPLLECTHYLRRMADIFSSCRSVQISWDPSTYAGDEVLVAACFSIDCACAGYLPIQYLLPVKSEELDEELRALAGIKKVTRVAGFAELRGLAHAMASINMSLDVFQIPDDVLWKPLKEHEERKLKQGKYMVCNKLTNEEKPQVPEGYSFTRQCTMVSLTDQGAVNLGALDYIVYHLKLTILCGYDKQHRTWNDLKSGLRASKLMKSFYAFALLYNINYGPMQSKAWFQRKRAALFKFLEEKSPHSSLFMQYFPKICSERGLLESGLPAQREEVFLDLKNSRTCAVHGPLTKLMRWFSWWEANEFYSGEVWVTRMVMLYESNAEFDDQDLDEAFVIPGGLNPKEELRQLKIKHGGWGLAPGLVTKATMFDRGLIAELGRPLWSLYADFTKNVRTTGDVEKQYIKMAGGAWKDELLLLAHNGFFDTGTFQKIYSEDGTGSSANLEKHCNFLVHLLSKRAKSLVGTFCRPPWRYAGLGGDGVLYAHASATMDFEWKLFLAAEAMVARGKDLPLLKTLHFLQSSCVRLQYLANEADILNAKASTNADAVHLSKVACHHLGDTVLVETTHQKVKDKLRAARHQQASRLSKWHSVITCNVLEGRDIPFVKVTDLEKAQAGRGKLLPVLRSTNTNSLPMRKQYQELMKYKSTHSSFQWPSTSQDSLFNEVASMECLLSFGDRLAPGSPELESCNTACLVGKPGGLLAFQPTGQLIVVVAVGIFAFFGWVAEVTERTPDGIIAQLCRQKSALDWFFVSDVGDWLYIPAQMAFLNKFGPVGWQQCGEPVELLEARVQEGLSLTIKQCQLVLNHYKVQYGSQDRKRHLIAIFSLFSD